MLIALLLTGVRTIFWVAPPKKLSGYVRFGISKTGTPALVRILKKADQCMELGNSVDAFALHLVFQSEPDRRILVVVTRRQCDHVGARSSRFYQILCYRSQSTRLELSLLILEWVPKRLR